MTRNDIDKHMSEDHIPAPTKQPRKRPSVVNREYDDTKPTRRKTPSRKIKPVPVPPTETPTPMPVTIPEPQAELNTVVKAVKKAVDAPEHAPIPETAKVVETVFCQREFKQEQAKAIAREHAAFDRTIKANQGSGVYETPVEETVVQEPVTEETEPAEEVKVTPVKTRADFISSVSIMSDFFK